MGNLNVAVLGAEGYARALGKRSTASDIAFYDLKKGETTVSFVEPLRYPEKLAPLFYACSLADLAILVIDQLTPSFGESILMLDCVGVKEGYVVPRNYITSAQLEPLVKGTVLERYEIVEDNPILLRERLLGKAESLNGAGISKSHSASGSVPIDHHFDVGGVGTVVLGEVIEGAIRRHQTLNLLPGGKNVVVRSIQKHDDDSEGATEGDRVGIALKGVENHELDRGMVLTSDERVKASSTVKGTARLVKYWLNPIQAGAVLHIGHWMQFEPARVDSVEPSVDWRETTVTLSLKNHLVYRAGNRAVLTYLEGGKLRVMGTLELY